MIAGVRQSPAGGHIFIVAVFALVAGLSGLMTVPPLDRDESRFIQATTQMIETGDYVRIRFQNEERNKKPVGIYWLQAASVQTLADVEDRPLWAFRLPSLIAAMLAAIFTYLAGCALFGTSPAFLGAVLLAAAPVVMGEASIAKTDASLLASICAMQAALAWLVTSPDPSRRTAAGFWIALGAGILLKGPIAPLIAAGSLAGLVFVTGGAWRSLLHRLRPLLGLLIMALMILPWAVAIGITTDGRFFTEAVGIDMVGKLAGVQEDHGAPPGAHLGLFWLMFWPAGLFALAAAAHVIPRWREPAILFCIAWLVPMWLVFEIAPTKLPHYPMVLYPAIALLIGQTLRALPESKLRGLRLGGALIYAVVGLAALVALLIFTQHFSSAGLVIWHYLAAALIAGVTLLAAAFVVLKQSGRALAAACLASSLLGWGAFEGVLPTLDRLSLTPRLADMLDDNEAHPLKDNSGAIALVGYSEPSAVFTFGTDTRLLRPGEAVVWITSAPNRAVVVEERDEAAFFAELPAGREVVRVASIEGFNYSKNRDVRLTLFRLR